MPLGLWKSGWERHREEMDRRHAEWSEEMDRRQVAFRDEMARRDAKFRQVMISRDVAFREKMEVRDADFRAERAEADATVREEHARAETARIQADEEWRVRYAELLARLDENHRDAMAELRAGFKMMADELRAVRRELSDLTDAVNANTEAVLKLIDRFDQWEGRPPGSGRMGPRSA